MALKQLLAAHFAVAVGAASPRQPALLRKASVGAHATGATNGTQLPTVDLYSLPSAAGTLPELNLVPVSNAELHHTVVGSNAYGTPMAQSTVKLDNGKELTYDEIAYGYNRLWQDLGMWVMMRWQGVPFMQSPNDAAAMQQLLWNSQPGLVVEIGTYAGGSALYYGEIMRNYEQCNGCSKLITVDVNADKVSPVLSEPRNYNIEFRLNDKSHIPYIEEQASAFSKVMVIHDGDHSYDGVLNSLHTYDKYVTVGSYFVVQDTSLDRMQTKDTPAACRGGTMKAVQDFLAGKGANRYIIDKTYEYLIFSTSHKGYLRKIAI